MKTLIPTEDVHIVVRMQHDAKSIAQEAYERAWLKARVEGRRLPEPPSVPTGGPILRTDVIRIHIPCRLR
jgi:hypothetical protein